MLSPIILSLMIRLPVLFAPRDFILTPVGDTEALTELSLLVFTELVEGRGFPWLSIAATLPLVPAVELVWGPPQCFLILATLSHACSLPVIELFLIIIMPTELGSGYFL